ncbi:hypothetical protein [Bordetella avium]|uniref:phage baseplate plug family protein n=1 Tax=Bordetella avium TaxID=521 RepID=UPI000E1A063A|nr:hypothetical protein [Bordetella avium]SUW69020.1 phage protein [Bordetella avium]
MKPEYGTLPPEKVAKKNQSSTVQRGQADGQREGRKQYFGTWREGGAEMVQLDLIRAPNQAFSVVIDGVLWELAIKTPGRSCVLTSRGMARCWFRVSALLRTPPILPYRHLSLRGNFAILTRDDDLPWWEEFGRSQSLVYLTAAEVGINDD